MHPSEGRAIPLAHEQGLSAQDPQRSDQNFGVNSEAEGFVKFDRQIKALDKSLQGFINAMRPIGSSDDLISSASSLRTRLVDLHSGFRRNAARLFPELERLDAIKEMPWRGAHPLSRHRANPSPDAVMTPTILGNLLNNCAQELIWLLQLLNEFPEFTDDVMNTSSLNFYDDLRYWASCLLDYGVVKNPVSIVGLPQDEQYRPINRHINHLPGEMGDYLTELNAALIMFVDVGVPAIRTAQDRATTRLQNLSTVATFLSAVTGATLQYSYA
ncbi:hypothetical protein BS47DRAFT_627541 [Hydnum rufescens UP504]|uniref:Uncharacterized protein n=1 Tax=Hydnum rufescens UP504 TaxID=1448309 RepID=A0A9P6B3C7_9AGAM|nr:hypothetical protein BS47DRAFT_627541 [Hydnum rufescens UP504]